LVLGGHWVTDCSAAGSSPLPFALLLLFFLQLAVDNPVTTEEDQDPLENDQSLSGGPLALDGVTDGENGSCEINEYGTVTCTPNV